MNLNFQLLRLELFVESDGLTPIHVVLESGRKGSSSIGWRQLLQQQRCWRHMESVEFRHPVGSCRNYVGIKLESWWIVGQRRFAGLWRWTDWKRWNHPLSQTRESHVLLASSRLYCKGGGKCKAQQSLQCGRDDDRRYPAAVIPAIWPFGSFRSSGKAQKFFGEKATLTVLREGRMHRFEWMRMMVMISCIGRHGHFFEA